jgi:hypothetical protein
MTTFLSLLLLLSVQSHARERVVPVAESGTPAWARQGSVVFKESAGEGVFYGVGVVQGIRNRALAVTAADDRARAEVAKLASAYIAKLAESQGGSAESLKVAVKRAVSEAIITDHWKDSSDGALYSLCKLDLRTLKRNLPDEAGADRAFDNMNLARVSADAPAVVCEPAYLAESARRMRELDRARKASIAKDGTFLWDDSFKPLRGVETYCRGLDAVGALASLALKDAFAARVGQPPVVPPKLVQGKYESRALFDARVEKARSEYDALHKAYQEKAEQARAIVERDKPQWLARAFLSVFGAPRIENTYYDANDGLFSLRVGGEGELAGGTSFFLVLNDTVPNEKASEFDSRLKGADIGIRFTVQGARLDILGADLVIKGKTYAALPAAGAEAAQPAVADFAAPSGAAAAPELAVQYAQSPEIQAKVQQLEALRSQKAKKEELARLERQIAQMSGEGAPEKALSSDVDEPGFHRPQRPEDYALVAGVETYQQNLPKADFAERDATAVKKYLMALGVPEQNVILLTGAQATKSALQGYLEEWLPKNVKPDTRLYFYYSGHGAPDTKDGSAYLVPWDGNPALLKSTAYPLKRLYAGLAQLKAKEVFIAMDACFSGAGGRSVLARGARPLVNVQEEAEDLGENLTLFAAAKGDEITGGLEEQGHGLFTYYFLKGLRSGAKDAEGLFEFLKPKVSQGARRQNREQDPVFKGANISFQSK